ncbi:sensor histidine kinase [Deinococcus murrayi]|uniref:sensor histidine kinase n=1 Tax=Deinococcus murrayi TaxID=68910 RepID=UPI00048102AD|nr:HAMP domain-containing sensor histidine kinase [Deinococcus murrayi]
MTRPAPLQSARVAWRHSLRFRLALTYTLLATLVIGLVGIGMLTLLLRGMEGQFQARLNDRAAAIAERLSVPELTLGQKLPPISGYTALLDDENRVIQASPTLQLRLGQPFPYAGQSSFLILGTPMRAVTRPVEDFGTVWVALPEDDLVNARESATRALLLALLLTPGVMLIVGWWVGRRALADLSEAADLADRIDPTRSVATLPLPEREDEVHRLLAALNRLLVRIEAVQAREKQLLGQIVHELGAPLTVLRASLTRAAERTPDPEVARAALVADELTFTTQDLMQLARGQLEMKVAWHFIPAATLRGRLDRLVPGITFAGDWSGMLLCDPDRLTQALRNLLANARRAAGPEGEVTLTLSETPAEVTFTVRDSGPGLPPELGERIFEPFVSGSGSSGLGLSVSRQIAALHSGTLTAGHAPGGGAEFVLTLPGPELGEDEEADAASPQNTPSGAAAPAS